MCEQEKNGKEMAKEIRRDLAESEGILKKVRRNMRAAGDKDGGKILREAIQKVRDVRRHVIEVSK